MRQYIKRVIKAVLNRPVEQQHYSMDKNYVINVGADKRFENKIVFVTGASGAIGGAIAWRFAYEGATVYLGGRNKEKLQSVATEMSAQGICGIPCMIDVTDQQSVESTVNSVMEKSGRIDILVNCAGGSTRGNCANLVDQSVEMIDEMLVTNLRGSMLCTRVVGKQMTLAKSGKIINIASVIGEHGKPKFTDYAASKAGIIGYTKSVAQELGAYGINVNCVSPGFIQRGEFTESQLPYLLNSNFLNKIGSSEDIASAVAYLASEEAGFITGQNLCVDGGRSLGLHGD